MKRTAIPRSTPLRRRTPLRAHAPQKKRRPPQYRERTCAVCSTPFMPTAGIQKYCGPSCREQAEKEPRVCPFCNQTFEIARSARVKYCSTRCSNRATWAKRRGTREKAPKRHWGVGLKGELLCRCCGGKAVHLHHVVPRSKSRSAATNIECNGIPLCADCHGGWHERRVTITHHVLTDQEFAFVVQLAGSSWLERNYPDGDIAALLALDRVRRGDFLAAPVIYEPMRARTLRLLGTEWLPEASIAQLQRLTGDRYYPKES